MRIVLDTNVVLSALLWRGTPHRLLAELRGKAGFQLYSSPTLIEELGEVLDRPSCAERLALISRSAQEVLADYAECVAVVEINHVPNVIASDPDDNHVLACALAARADMIVSGDKHLLNLGGSYRGIRIVNPAEAVAALGAR